MFFNIEKLDHLGRLVIQCAFVFANLEPVLDQEADELYGEELFFEATIVVQERFILKNLVLF